ncbi:hypothetical protein [Clostridium sp.]|uniref:hypothetical protein n=1 Tax=Clostridium sp. TaxID=1506 RepID=UPI002FDEE653
MGTLLMVFLLSSTVFASNRWVPKNGNWNLLNEHGSALTGWQQDGEKWYYMDRYGSMITGWANYGGKWYYLNPSGDMKTGWLSYKGHWYYLNPNGDMTTGWKIDNSKSYYLNADGSMATGWKQIDSKWYYFNTNGDMAVNTTTSDGYTIGIDGTWDGKTKISIYNPNLKNDLMAAVDNAYKTYVFKIYFVPISYAGPDSTDIENGLQPKLDAEAKVQGAGGQFLNYSFSKGDATFNLYRANLTRIVTSSNDANEILQQLVQKGAFNNSASDYGLFSVYHDTSTDTNTVVVLTFNYMVARIVL